MPSNTKPQTPSYKISILARLFASNNDFTSINITLDGFLFIGPKGRKRQISFLDVDTEATITSGWFWDALTFKLENESFHFGGVDKEQSQQLKTICNHLILRNIKSYYQKLEPALSKAAHEAESLIYGKKYIRQNSINQWLLKHQDLTLCLKRKDFSQHLSIDGAKNYKTISPLLNDRYEYVSLLNNAFIELQLATYKDFFDRVESNPLTHQQRKACVIDEQHNLILAGAGTGKTSTMIGRAGYLVNSGLADPKQILMLAYARKAAEEMDQRIQEKLNIQNLTVKTFHSLGMNIIAKVEGVVPNINKMAEDELLRASFVDTEIQRMLKDDQYKSKLISYLINFSYPFKGQEEFKSLGEYNAYILENDIRTLQGELVKSYEECEIANFLFMQGIPYEYEVNYKINTSGPDFKAYQPDFYLPDYDIYIEHFAVNEHNQTPSFIDHQSYINGMDWKRDLHQKHQTTLIETYSYLKKQGRLTEVLHEKLLEANVQFNPLPENELLEKLNELGKVSDFGHLMAQVLVLFKSANSDIKALIELATKQENQDCFLVAVELFKPIYEAYQQELRNTDSIDFEDMIGKAVHFVESGRYTSTYLYLLIDEFQDISASRARLLKALMAQQSTSSLFCVGDDWQAIYRFTGSNVSLTKDFVSHFGHTSTSILDKTFRFNNKIGEVASMFVTQNPSQIKKEIHSHNNIERKAVSLIKTSQVMTGLSAALSAINEKSKGPVSVLLLARFNFKKPDLSQVKRQYPQIKMQFMSVHASKGKEADYVIIFGLEKGKHGFPSEKATHPLLEILLPEAEDYKHAEERRLFYVSLTRARHHVYLITDGNKSSPFIHEMVANNYPILLDEFKGEGFQESLASIACSHCKTGFMVARNGSFGNFYGCSNFPLCNHTQRACQWCGGGLVNKDKFRVCENTECDYVEPICPKCGGTLTLRTGTYGKFWGCTNYRSDGDFSCTHKEKSIDFKAARSV